MLDLRQPPGTGGWPWLGILTLQTLGLLLVATLVFDVVHYILHSFARSRLRLFRRLGALHQTHHEFFNRELQFVEDLSARNLREHVIPEFLTRIAVAAAGVAVVSPLAVLLVLGIQLVQLVFVIRCKGRDSNHVAFDVLRRPTNALLVGPRYHALHHLYPDAYYSSFVTVLDGVFGTALSLKDRRIAMTGMSGAFGSALQRILEKEGASVRGLKFGVDYTYADYGLLDPALEGADILVLAHGSKKESAMQANCDSFVAIIERFLALQKKRRHPVEIWAVGSEIECHPAWGNPDLQIYLESKRAFAKHAYGYYRDDRFVYRHICPSGFHSRMGWAPLPAGAAAAMAMFLIRRGFRYVPVTYTGIAFLNYFKFLFCGGQAKSGIHSTPRIAS
jgi:sterol desaturase/sphingolipid hydroxylase (fatty acid hydroxylase superfamily)